MIFPRNPVLNERGRMALAVVNVTNYAIRFADGGSMALAAEPVAMSVSSRHRIIAASFPL